MALPSNAHLIWHPFVGWCRHEYPPFPGLYNFIDLGVVNGLTGLFAWPTDEFPYPPARKPMRGGILAWHAPMEGQGTDANPIVIHVPVPPAPSAFLGVIVLLGSSIISMGSSRTRIWCKGLAGGEAEQSVGCCMFPYVPFSANMQCWDLNSKKLDLKFGAQMPTDLVIAPNTVQVGIGLADYVAVMVSWAVAIVTGIVMAAGTKAVTPKSKPPTGKKLAKATLAGDKAAAKARQKALKKGLSKEAADKAAERARESAFKYATTSLGKKYGTAVLGIAAKGLTRTEWYQNASKRPAILD